MIIKETIERECCFREDLKPYQGTMSERTSGENKREKFMFCIHCGQIWVTTRQSDGTGGRETVLEKIDI